MYRTSNYAVIVPVRGDPDRYHLHHGILGGVETIHRVAAEWLMAQRVRPAHPPAWGQWRSSLVLPGPKVEPEVDAATLEGFVDRRFVTSSSVEEEAAAYQSLLTRLRGRALAAATGYDFRVARPGVGRREPECMSVETVEDIWSAVAEFEIHEGMPRERSMPRRVGLVGREPLTETHPSVLDRIVTGAHALGPARLWAETTGTVELRPVEHLLGPDRIAELFVRFGRHEAQAPQHPGYAESIDRVLRHARACRASGVRMVVRVAVDRSNVQALLDLASGLVTGGSDGVTLQAVPARPERGEPATEHHLERWELDDLLAELGTTHTALRSVALGEVIAVPDQAVQRLKTDLLQQYLSGFRRHSYVFGPSGNVFADSADADDPLLRIGRVQRGSGIVLDPALSVQSRHRLGAAASPCRTCPFCSHCGWGRELRRTGSVAAVHRDACDGFGAHVRDAIAIEQASLGERDAYQGVPSRPPAATSGVGDDLTGERIEP